MPGFQVKFRIEAPNIKHCW